MMALCNLPPEILASIIYDVLPEGFESLALTCKALHTSCSGLIQQHNHMKKNWSHFSFNHDACELINTHHLLLEVVRTPLIARYIKYLDLWDRRGLDWENGKIDFLDPLRWQRMCEICDSDAPESLQKAFVQAMQSNVILQQAGIDIGRWTQKISDFQDTWEDDYPSSNSHATVTLLTLLPNVKTLQLPVRWQDNHPGYTETVDDLRVSDDARDLGKILDDRDARDLWKVLDELAVTSCMQQQGTERPLARLETILPCAPAGYDNHSGAFSSLTPFLLLPQVTTLYASGHKLCDDGYTGKPFGQWRYKGCVSRLRHIELAACCMDSTIDLFLAHVPELRILRYSHETKWHGCQHDWSAGELVAAIGRCCGGTVEDLAITIDCLYGEVVTGVVSMKEFTALKRLEVDVSIFCGPSIASGMRLGHGGNQPSWELEHMAALVDILPSSLESLTMVGFGHEADVRQSIERFDMVVQRLFADFARRRETMLPNLSHVSVKKLGSNLGCQLPSEEWDRDLEVQQYQVKKLERLCAGADIDFEYDAAGNTFVEAPWRGAFCERFPYVDDYTN